MKGNAPRAGAALELPHCDEGNDRGRDHLVTPSEPAGESHASERVRECRQSMDTIKYINSEMRMPHTNNFFTLV